MKPNLYTMMFNTVLSIDFGRTFWLDEQKELCSAPTFTDGSTDWDMSDYVCDWTDLDGINLGKLLDIQKSLLKDFQ
tara:strand:- start:92 stop:319 length:228 start_codon:yes stop_codon:yes gene_type:complete